MNIRNKSMWKLFLCGSAGVLLSCSPSLVQAQDEEGGRRGRPGARDGDREEGARRGGPRGRQGEGRPGGGPGGPGGQGGRGGSGGGPEMLMRLPVIAALDADGDGVISKEEIANATAALKKLDKNKDGKITFQEMRPDFGPGGAGGRGMGDRGAGGPGVAGRGRPDGERGGRPDSGGGRPGAEGGRPGGAGGPGAAGARDPRAMMDRLFAQDKDDDGLLSKDELPEMMVRMLDRADSNGDGKLSRDEMEKALEARAKAMRGGEGRPGGGRPGAGRPGSGRAGGGRDSDVPGGQKPRRPAAE